MKYRVIVEPPARANLDEAYVWIAERNPEAAVKWFNGLEEAIRTLEDFPQRFEGHAGIEQVATHWLDGISHGKALTRKP